MGTAVGLCGYNFVVHQSKQLRDWEIHLNATHEMMNLFVSTEHFLYAKSTRFYLQQMLELLKNHPEIYALFKDHGYHTTHCIKYWAGLWSDLVTNRC